MARAAAIGATHTCGEDRADEGSPSPSPIMRDSPIVDGKPAMEAEQVNAIASMLAGLKDRTAQLRRYL